MRTESEAEILSRIEETRERMGATIEEIGGRANPDRVQRVLRSRARERINEAKESVKRKAKGAMRGIQHGAGDAGRGIWHRVRSHPFHAGMVGIGLAWLLARGRGDEEEVGTYGAYSEPGAGGVRERVGRAGHRAGDMIRDHPLATALVVASLGFGAGLVVPESRREKEIMGGARRRAGERVTRSLHDAGEAAKEAARETAGDSARAAMDRILHPREEGPRPDGPAGELGRRP